MADQLCTPVDDPAAPAGGAAAPPAAVRAAIRARAGETTAPLVERLLRPSVVLIPAADPAAEAPDPADPAAPDPADPAVADGPAGRGGEGIPAGWFGGLPALPEGEEWPAYAGRPMQLVAQLDCAALSRALGGDARGEGRLLPASGLLLFFHDQWFSDYRGAGCRVLHVPAGAPPRPAPEGADAVPAVPVLARCALSAPSYQDTELESLLPDDFLAALDLAADFRDHLPAYGARVLGWCDTDTGRPAGHRTLLQVESGELAAAWGEVVNVSFWITGEDLAAGRFDRVRQGFEVA